VPNRHHSRHSFAVSIAVAVAVALLVCHPVRDLLFASAVAVAFAIVLTVALPCRHSERSEEPLYFAFPDGAKRRTKINPSTLHKLHHYKTCIPQTTLTTQSTTLCPQDHHI
jgi:hypothetical protein